MIVVDATLGHCRDIVSQVRGGKRLFDTLQFGIERSSLAKTALLKDTPACMWGVIEESMLGPANVWMAATPHVEKNSLLFLRESKKFIRSSVERYGTLYGSVESSFIKSQNWMKWLGFSPIAEVDGIITYEMKNGH